MINDLWYKNAVVYCLSLPTFLDASGDGIGDFGGFLEKGEREKRGWAGSAADHDYSIYSISLFARNKKVKKSTKNLRIAHEPACAPAFQRKTTFATGSS